MTIRTVEDLEFMGYRLPVAGRTCIMGVLNVTPDSFSDGGMFADVDAAVERGLRMAEEGADIIDIGGESTRPGSERVSEEEELSRVVPVIKTLRPKVKVPLSIDTCKSEVARQALAEGASMVNDITALRGDAEMAGVIAGSGAAVVLMHMLGDDPKTMQEDPVYSDVVGDICSYLSGAMDAAEEAGISREKTILDPGIGFGKTVEHNLAILKHLDRVVAMERPVLVGTSRKSFIGALTGRNTAEREFGTAATVAAAIMKGASIIRVHDVSHMRDAALVADAIRGV